MVRARQTDDSSVGNHRDTEEFDCSHFQCYLILRRLSSTHTALFIWLILRQINLGVCWTRAENISHFWAHAALRTECSCFLLQDSTAKLDHRESDEWRFNLVPLFCSSVTGDMLGRQQRFSLSSRNLFTRSSEKNLGSLKTPCRPSTFSVNCHSCLICCSNQKPVFNNTH